MQSRLVLMAALVSLLAQADEPTNARPAPGQVVRVYGLYSLGVLESFSSSGQASFHDFCLPCAQGASGMPFSIGVGQRSTPTFATPLLVDLEQDNDAALTVSELRAPARRRASAPATPASRAEWRTECR